MPVPDFQSLMLPLLRMTVDDQEHTLAEVVERLGQEFSLSDDDRTQLLQSGQTRLYNRVAWTTTYLRKAGLLRAVAPGRFQLTERGRQVLASRPETIDVAFLESRFPEMLEFRKRPAGGATEGESPATFNVAERSWTMRPGVEEKVREKLDHSVPNEETRRAALALLAFAIENADEERRDAWLLRETSHGLALMAGRLLSCEATRSKIRVSVIGPVSDEVRAAIGAEAEDDAQFKTIPGGLLLTLPVEHARDALRLLQDGLNSFIDLAMTRVRRAVSLEDHMPEAVAYVASVVGRELPQPEPGAEPPEMQQLDDASDDDDDDGGFA